MKASRDTIIVHRILAMLIILHCQVACRDERTCHHHWVPSQYKMYKLSIRPRFERLLRLGFLNGTLEPIKISKWFIESKNKQANIKHPADVSSKLMKEQNKIILAVKRWPGRLLLFPSRQSIYNASGVQILLFCVLGSKVGTSRVCFCFGRMYFFLISNYNCHICMSP